MNELKSWIDDELIRPYLFLHYYAFSVDAEADNWLIKVLVDNIPKSMQDIIEFGCGTGNITIELAKHGFNVIGTDSSKAMIELAKSRMESQASSLKGKVKLVLEDMRKPCMEKADAAFTTSLGHLLRPEDRVTFFKNVKDYNMCRALYIYVPFILQRETPCLCEKEWETEVNNNKLTFRTLSSTDFHKKIHHVHYVFRYKNTEYTIKYCFAFFDDEDIEKIADLSGWKINNIFINGKLRDEKKKNMLIMERIYELVYK